MLIAIARVWLGTFLNGWRERHGRIPTQKRTFFLQAGKPLLGLCLLLAGCVSQSLPPPASSLPTGGESLIQPDDTLEITFSEEPTLTQQTKVTGEGRIFLSYLAAKGKEEVRAGGRTPSQVAGDINRLAKDNGILKFPLSQVRVVGYAERAFSLFGEVRNPGRYAFTPAYASYMNLPEAVAMGGGFTEFANRSIVLVKRGSDLYRIRFREMLTGSKVAQFQVLPGDIITVERSWF